MLIMPPPQEMSLVQNLRSITIIANDILYNKLVQHINADLKFEVTKICLNVGKCIACV